MSAQKPLPQKPQQSKRLLWRPLFIFSIVLGALVIATVWILSGLNIIPSIWAIILSAIIPVLGAVIGLWPIVFPPKNIEQELRSLGNIQEVTATKHSKVTEPEQTIKERGGTNRQTIEASDNSEISQPKQNIELI